jgi:hypothetical protein
MNYYKKCCNNDESVIVSIEIESTASYKYDFAVLFSVD